MSQFRTEPMWFCYECENEMHPLMTPNPQCPRCHGSFVEKIENPNDDPRTFQQHGIPDGFNPFAFGGGFNDIFSSFGSPTNERRRSDSIDIPRSGDRPRPTSPHTGGLRFEFHTTGPGGMRTSTVVFGGNNTLNRETPDLGRTPNLSDFLHANDEASGATAPREPRIPGQLMAQYLMSLMGGPGGHALHPFMDMDAGGIDRGRWGDYVFSQEALDQLMTQLMEGANSNRPVPATEEITNNLPREELAEGSPLLEKDCAVCKDQFSTDVDDPSEKKVVTLPCKHPFHEGCILPWLKSSGTCPVCRYQLVPQPDSHSPGERPSGNNRPSSPEDERHRSSSMSAPSAPGGANTTGSRPSPARQASGEHRTHFSLGLGGSGAGGRGTFFPAPRNLGGPSLGGPNVGPAGLFNMLLGGAGRRGSMRGNRQPQSPQSGSGNEPQGGSNSSNGSNSNTRPNDRSSGRGSENPPGGWSHWGDELD